MKIKVLFFARLREIFGESCRFDEVPEGSCVGEVAERLVEECDEPALKEIPLIFAVNENFESCDRKLKDQDQLALMTPMSGG